LAGFEDVPREGETRMYHYVNDYFRQEAGINPNFPFIEGIPSYEPNDGIVDCTEGYSNLSTEYMAGGLLSSVTDITKFANAIRKPGMLLDEAMWKEFLQYNPPHEKHAPNDLYDEYCQGIMHSHDWFGTKLDVYHHMGGTLGYSCFFGWLKDYDASFCIAHNVGAMHTPIPRPHHLDYWVNELFPAIAQFIKQ